ncbi:hypothetical protein NX059_000370 [Plenodomus lindquistii]|nr:hypothetical protein NX059_000370 [Plenodomus lindquistii]
MSFFEYLAKQRQARSAQDQAIEDAIGTENDEQKELREAVEKLLADPFVPSNCEQEAQAFATEYQKKRRQTGEMVQGPAASKRPLEDGEVEGARFTPKRRRPRDVYVIEEDDDQSQYSDTDHRGNLRAPGDSVGRQVTVTQQREESASGHGNLRSLRQSAGLVADSSRLSHRVGMLSSQSLPTDNRAGSKVTDVSLRSMGLPSQLHQADDRGLPVALRFPSGWVTGSGSLTRELVDTLLSFISGSHERKSQWDKIGVQSKGCILGKVIGKTTTEVSGGTSTEACSTCTGDRQGRGRRVAAARPCAVLIHHEGTLTIGFFPLPSRLREGKPWTDRGYWIREE